MKKEGRLTSSEIGHLRKLLYADNQKLEDLFGEFGGEGWKKLRELKTRNEIILSKLSVSKLNLED